MPLPVDGSLDWGDTLNAYLNTLQSEADQTRTTLSSHSANNPADPHGDRTYAQSLVNPIVNGVNLPNGFVQLNSSGTIPANLITGGSSGGGGSVAGGMFNGVFDAGATYGAIANNGSDQSSAIQAACNAATSAGGGIVWVGPGVFSLKNYIFLGSGTHLMMSEQTTLQRIPGGTNGRYLVTNIQFGTSNTPSVNTKITGGTLDAVGSSSLTSTCTPIFIVQGYRTKIENVQVNNVFGNPAIEINGCNNTWINECVFTGTGSIFTTSGTPAVRVNVSSSSTTPSGLNGSVYNNTVTNDMRLTFSHMSAPTGGTIAGAYGALIGSDLVAGSHNSDHIIVVGCSTKTTSYLGSAIFSNGAWSNSTSSANQFFESAP